MSLSHLPLKRNIPLNKAGIQTRTQCVYFPVTFFSRSRETKETAVTERLLSHFSQSLRTSRRNRDVARLISEKF